MSKIEVVSKYAAAGLPTPQRGTTGAAGYDFVVAEDTVVPSYHSIWHKAMESVNSNTRPITLEEMAAFTKKTGCKPTLVPTGMKCQLDRRQYLELSVRSSTPFKYWLFLANGVGRL